MQNAQKTRDAARARRSDVAAVSSRASDGGSEREARAIVETALAGDQHNRSRSQTGE